MVGLKVVGYTTLALCVASFRVLTLHSRNTVGLKKQEDA